MTKASNLIAKPNFLHTLIGLVVGVLILVATAGFVFIPYSLSGHPGEVTVGAGNSAAYHAT